MRQRAALLLILAGAGCAFDGKHRPARAPLEKAVVFREQSLRGDWRELSRREEAGPAVRVPDPAEVDVNSSIHVELVKEALAPRSAPSLPETESEKRGADRARLVSVLDAVTEHIRARAETLEALPAYTALPLDRRAGSAAEATFRKAAGVYDKSKLRVLKAVEALWPPEGAVGKQVDAMMEDPTLGLLLEHARRELEAFDQDSRALVERTRRRAASLRLEAFLLSPGAAPAAVHLPGYDSLEQKAIRTHDKMGLALTAEERRVFETAARSAFELAEAAQRVRNGEASLREAFAGASLPMLRKIAEDLDVVLRAARDPGTLKAKVTQAVADLRAFGTSLAADLRDEAKAALARAVEAAVASLESSGGPDGALPLALRIALDAKALKEAVEEGRPDAILRAVALAERIAGAVENREALLKGAAASAEQALAAALKSVEAELPAVKEKAAAAWKTSRARSGLEELAGLAGAAGRLVATVKDAAELLLGRPPVDAALRVPEAVEVPVDRAPDTALDLQRTSRLVGDTVTLRATLLQEGKEVEQSEASFVVREFGWHARLQPGVVLASPLRMASGEEDFAFAPEVSWLHGYTPRPEESGVWAGFHRLLSPSVGLHAAFLNFFPDKEVEIGLGGSLAFGNDWLVLGAGYNLFSEDKRDGDWYYFVGTSLIPILQTVGLGPAAGGGERP